MVLFDILLFPEACLLLCHPFIKFRYCLNFHRFYYVLLPNGNLISLSAMYNYDPVTGAGVTKDVHS